MDELSSRMNTHCKACDAKFYSSYKEKLGDFENLCPKCLGLAMKAARNDEVVYGNCTDKWRQGDQYSDQGFLEGYAEEGTLAISDSLLADDPYHEYGEGAMGDLNLLDKY